jgi:hypothetical protein
MNANDFSKEALIERYSHWRKQIEQGDFKVYINDKGCVTIEWPNTSIFKPSFEQLEHVVHTEYWELECEQVSVSSGIVSLVVSTSVQRVRC